MANFPFKNLLFLMQKRTFSSASPSPSPSPSFTVKYLMESCGLSSNSALSISQKFKLDEQNLQNPDSVITFFKSHGFDNTHIVKLIEKRPKLLNYQVDENLKPKMEYLVQNGFHGQDLPDLIARNPAILTSNLGSSIKSAVDFLMGFLGTNEIVIKAVKRSPWLLSSDLKGTMQPNVDVLINEGVPVDSVAKLILMQPTVMIQKVHRMSSMVKTVKEMGIEPASTTFIHAVRVMLSMSESGWKKRVEVFKSFGWSEEEILSLLRRDPLCLACSEEKIRNTMDFFVNTVKLKPETIIGCPKVILHPIDKRMLPRYNVLRVLVEKELLRGKIKLNRLLFESDEDFLKNYVTKHLDQIPDLMEIYGIAKEDI